MSFTYKSQVEEKTGGKSNQNQKQSQTYVILIVNEIST